jgi:ATP-dependent DNA ligase
MMQPLSSHFDWRPPVLRGHPGRRKAFYKAADAIWLEGIVSERADAAYVSGRTRT